MDPKRIADELEIHNLVHRYSDAVVRRDAEAWGKTWADEGEWQVFGDPVKGRDAVVAFWKTLMDTMPFVHQQPTGGLINFDEVDQGRATGTWYVTEYGFRPDAAGMLTLGHYHDDYIRENDAWCFASRRFHPLYMGPPDLSGKPRLLPEDD